MPLFISIEPQIAALKYISGLFETSKCKLKTLSCLKGGLLTPSKHFRKTWPSLFQWNHYLAIIFGAREFCSINLKSGVRGTRIGIELPNRAGMGKMQLSRCWWNTAPMSPRQHHYLTTSEGQHLAHSCLYEVIPTFIGQYPVACPNQGRTITQGDVHWCTT